MTTLDQIASQYAQLVLREEPTDRISTTPPGRRQPLAEQERETLQRLQKQIDRLPPEQQTQIASFVDSARQVGKAQESLNVALQMPFNPGGFNGQKEKQALEAAKARAEKKLRDMRTISVPDAKTSAPEAPAPAPQIRGVHLEYREDSIIPGLKTPVFVQDPKPAPTQEKNAQPADKIRGVHLEYREESIIPGLKTPVFVQDPKPAPTQEKNAQPADKIIDAIARSLKASGLIPSGGSPAGTMIPEVRDGQNHNTGGSTFPQQGLKER